MTLSRPGCIVRVVRLLLAAQKPQGERLISVSLHGKLDLILALYRASDHIAVRNYLQRRPFLSDVLLELHEKVQEYFGPNTPIVLQLVTEPEAEAAEDELYAVVQALLPRAEALAALHRLDEEWWIDQLDRTACSLAVDVEY